MMFVRTQRLLLRPGWREDAPALVSALADPAIATRLARVPWPYRLKDAERFLAGQQDSVLPDLLIFARTAGSPRLVGGIGLRRRESDGAIELGYWIARPFWALGFATEAGSALIRLADHSLRLPRLVAGHFVDNPASARVLRKLGFHPNGQVESRYCRARHAKLGCVLFERDSIWAQGVPSPLLAA